MALISLAGGVVTLFLQNFFNNKSRKSAEQSELLEKLVEGLQETQTQLLEKQYEAIKGLENAVEKLSTTVQQTANGHERSIAQLEQRVRELEKNR